MTSVLWWIYNRPIIKRHMNTCIKFSGWHLVSTPAIKHNIPSNITFSLAKPIYLPASSWITLFTFKFHSVIIIKASYWQNSNKSCCSSGASPTTRKRWLQQIVRDMKRAKLTINGPLVIDSFSLCRTVWNATKVSIQAVLNVAHIKCLKDMHVVIVTLER